METTKSTNKSDTGKRSPHKPNPKRRNKRQLNRANISIANGDKKRLLSPLDEFKKTARKYLIIVDDTYIDILFGSIAALYLDSKPVWLHLIGVPSSGRSEILKSCSGHPLIHSCDSLTENTLVSGRGGAEREPSLAPRLHLRTLMIEDFTRILEGDYKTTKEIFGQLRQLYDGAIRRDFGTGWSKEFKAKVNIITGVTESIYDHQNILSPLGERFVSFQLPTPSEEEILKRSLIAAKNDSLTQQDTEIKIAAHNVLNYIHRQRFGNDFIQNQPTMSDAMRSKIAQIAQVVAIARTGVKWDYQKRDIVRKANPEIPTRITKQLVTLARGVAFVRQEKSVSSKTMRDVVRVAWSSVPDFRRIIMEILGDIYPKGLPLSKLVPELRIGNQSVRKVLQELHHLYLITETKVKGDKGAPIIHYSLESKYVKSIRYLK